MRPDESKRSREDFEGMVARHRRAIERECAELKRLRTERDERLARIRAELDAARAEYEKAIEQGLDAMEAARKYRDRFGAWPEPKRRRPRRGWEGGEPAPVKPRPKPTPLVDGAEAPIE